MKKFLLTIYLLVISFLLLPCSVNAQELTLITENAPPNSYVENNKFTGRAVEIVQAVLKEIGMEGHRIHMYPWARGYKMLETKKNIALFATSRTQYRENLFKWAGPISDNEVNLYKLKSRKDIRFTTFDDLKKYRVGGGRNDQKSQYLSSKGVALQTVNEDRQNIDKLFRGRVDVIPYSSTRISYDITKKGYDPKQIEMIGNLKEISTLIYVAFSKSTDDEIVKKFQGGFDAIKKKGIQGEILEKWK
ncbi:MAG: transporter substrate-binding domain-containing protein [Candidatus Sedimenticola sp. (ex Thyasira tokunagai)]